MNKNKYFLIGLYLFLLVGILLIELVMAAAPVWTGADRNYSAVEDTPYYHNLTANITDYSSAILIDARSSGSLLIFQ